MNCTWLLRGPIREQRRSGWTRFRPGPNYLFGKDSSKWITNIPNFERVAVHDVLPGVDVVYYGNDRQLEYDFNLAAGVDPNGVLLNFGGSSG